MILNITERTFLRGYLYEGSHAPFSGPATKALRELGVFQSEIPHLLKAAVEPDEAPPLGEPLPEGIGAPWWDRGEVLRREAEVAAGGGEAYDLHKPEAANPFHTTPEAVTPEQKRLANNYPKLYTPADDPS